LDVTRDRELNVPEGEQETPEPPVERVKDDLMQDEEDTDGNV
jgi:hypothetical protein